jgi:hypothetical protein
VADGVAEVVAGDVALAGGLLVAGRARMQSAEKGMERVRGSALDVDVDVDVDVNVSVDVGVTSPTRPPAHGVRAAARLALGGGPCGP